MIEKIKKEIKEKKGSEVVVIVNNMRNRSEEYIGNIVETYNFIFIVKTNNDSIKSFNYSDVLTKDVVVIFK